MQASSAVEDLQKNLQEEQIIVEEKKAATQVRQLLDSAVFMPLPARPKDFPIWVAWADGLGFQANPGETTDGCMVITWHMFSQPLSGYCLYLCLQSLIESIGQEKAKVDEEVEKGREDEEGAAALQAEVTAFQEECARDLAAAEPIIQVRSA